MIVYSAYLFDAEQYLKAVQPFTENIVKGNYHPIYELAWNTVNLHPEVWKFLEDILLGASVDDFQHDLTDFDNVSVWLTVILGKYLHTTFFLRNYWWKHEVLKVALPMLGWSIREVNQLVIGKSTCSLFSLPDSADRCLLPGGWLSKEEILAKHRKVLEAQARFKELEGSPNPTDRTIIVRDRAVEVSEVLDTLTAIDKILASAIETDQDLFLTVA